MEPVKDVSEKEAIRTELAVIGSLDSADVAAETPIEELTGPAV